METPIIRAKAKDSADGLDNLVAYMEDGERTEVVDYVFSTLDDVRDVLRHAINNDLDPLKAYEAYLSKMREYFTKAA